MAYTIRICNDITSKEQVRSSFVTSHPSDDPRPNTNGPLAVDFKEGSRLTSLSPFTLRKYVRDGKLRATKCGRRWIIPMEELRRLVQEGSR